MSSKVDENDVHNMQYETGYDIHNEVRSESRFSETSLGSVTIAEYLNKDKIQNSISDEPQSDTDISIHSDSDLSEYKPTQRELKMAE